MIIDNSTPLIIKTLENLVSDGVEIGKTDFFEEMSKNWSPQSVDLNFWEIGDTFTIPKDRIDIRYFLCKKTRKDLFTGRRGRKIPVAFFITVRVYNTRNKCYSYKKFLFNDPIAKFYIFKKQEEEFINTGEYIQSNDPLSEAMKNLKTDAELMNHLLGKTLKVTDMLEGDAGVVDCNKIVGLRRKYIPVFSELKSYEFRSHFDEDIKTIINYQNILSKIEKRYKDEEKQLEEKEKKRQVNSPFNYDYAAALAADAVKKRSECVIPKIYSPDYKEREKKESIDNTEAINDSSSTIIKNTEEKIKFRTYKEFSEWVEDKLFDAIFEKSTLTITYQNRSLESKTYKIFNVSRSYEYGDDYIDASTMGHLDRISLRIDRIIAIDGVSYKSNKI